MKKFVNFTQKVLTDTYDNILNSVISAKIPSALFVSKSENNAVSIASSLKNVGMNLKRIIVVDKNEALKNLTPGGGVILTRF